MKGGEKEKKMIKPAQINTNAKHKALSAKRGFTLIELLVVIAIVGVLAAVVLIAINPARRLAQGRDSGRKSDIGQIATAAQAYFTTNSSYPSATQGLAELQLSGDLKSIPTPPNPNPGASGVAGYDYVPESATCAPATTDPCDEFALFEELEAPNVAGTPIWCYRSVTGRAGEAASCAP